MSKIPALDRPGPLLPWWMTAIVTGQSTNARLPLSHLGALPKGAIALSMANYVADTAATADADPGAGNLRWNHATQASATVIYLADADADSDNHSALWAAVAAGSYLYLYNPADLDVWQWWTVAAVTDAAGYVKLAVSLVGSAGSFGDDAPVVVTIQAPDVGAVDSVNSQTGVVVLGIDDLADVDAASPTNGYSLAWNSTSSKWEPSAPSGVNVQSTASTATLTPTYSNDVAEVTAQAASLTIANPSGTAVDGHGLVIRIKDNGTARALTWGSDYRVIGVTLPTTTVLGKQHYIACIRNSTAGKMDVLAVGVEA